jgi:hypothetical protein
VVDSDLRLDLTQEGSDGLLGREEQPELALAEPDPDSHALDVAPEPAKMAAPISARRFIYPTLLAYTLATLAINLKSARQTKETDLASLTAQATTLQRLLAAPALDSALVDRDLKAVGLPVLQPSIRPSNSHVRPFHGGSIWLIF